MTQIRDFTQLKITRDGDAEKIRQLTARARHLGIHTNDIESDTAWVLSDIDSRFGQHFADGSEHFVSDDDVGFIESSYRSLGGNCYALEQVLNHYDHFGQALAEFNRHCDELKNRAKNVKLADGVASNKLLEMYIEHASSYTESMENSRHAFDEALDAVKDRDLVRYNKLIVGARQFATREHFLKTLLRRGTLVAV